MDIRYWVSDLLSQVLSLKYLDFDLRSLSYGLWSLISDLWSLIFGLFADMQACREGYIDMKYPARVKVNAQGVLN